MEKPLLYILSSLSEFSRRLEADLVGEYRLEFFTYAGACLKGIQKQLPSAVILDHSFKDLDPYRLIDRVRNHPMTRNLTFIMVSRESGHSFVEQAVRSGVSHYIGVPFESKILIEKIKMALAEGKYSPKEEYFSLSTSEETQVVSFGRISYISEKGIHFETHLSLEPNTEISFRSPLSDALMVPHIPVKVVEVGSDVFYNYPYAVDANWVDEDVAKRIRAWIKTHQSLNSPKKSKVLFLTEHHDFEERLTDLIDKSQYSPRFEKDLESAFLSLPFMKPAAVVADVEVYKKASASSQARFISTLQVPWMIYGPEENFQVPADKMPLVIPGDPVSVVAAVKSKIPPKPIDKERIYFTKALEDSRLRLFLKGKVVVLGEMGVELLLEHALKAPCNLELDLKTFTDQNLRNPFIRVWPPVQKVSGPLSENAKYKIRVQSHFLGINDQQGQAIRKWLQDEELKENRKLIADKPPQK